MWTPQEIQLHCKAAQLLLTIKDEAFQFIRDHKQTTEWDVKEFILTKFKQYNLITNGDRPIVGFNASAAEPHYNPQRNSVQLKPGTLILIDIWARLKEGHAPYADITWMGFYGETVPEKMHTVVDTIFKARDAGIQLVQNELAAGRMPTGAAVDAETARVTIEAGFKEFIKHRTGHSIGFDSPHGTYPNVNSSNPEPLLENVGYTIEPGIYIDGEFGVRSEMDFYIAEKKIIITTPVQNKLIFI